MFSLSSHTSLSELEQRAAWRTVFKRPVYAVLLLQIPARVIEVIFVQDTVEDQDLGDKTT
jgi:hypothetical protein